MVFSSAYDKNKIFFEARKERNGIGFSRFRDHLASIINWLEVVNFEVEVTNVLESFDYCIIRINSHTHGLLP